MREGGGSDKYKTRDSEAERWIKVDINRRTVDGTKRRLRKRTATWFNPPYAVHLQSNVAKSFLGH